MNGNQKLEISGPELFSSFKSSRLTQKWICGPEAKFCSKPIFSLIYHMYLDIYGVLAVWHLFTLS